MRSPGSQYHSPFLVPTAPPIDVNKNTAWFSYPGVWTTYLIIVVLVWLLILIVFQCSVASACVAVNIIHFVVTFYLFHWKKGSPFAEDQGLYDRLTWWEQIDGRRQLTPNRKFLTLVPVLLYLITSFYMRHEPNSELFFVINTVLVFALVIAKLPALDKVRIFGINFD
ncbi:hypothetical protein CLOM_g2101 [Closterium sp. NIES-68]|nr:hypothetical protein CLOM_g2101 [Closterium sp. NIES-68]GJP71786.1 hypothetical protein CLOP_g2578 [Closterium sp. NIES-67]